MTSQTPNINGTDRLTQKADFAENGYLVVDDFLTSDELSAMREVCDKLLSNEVDTSAHRHDLGGFAQQKVKDKENICQIMWPSIYVPKLKQSSVFEKAINLARTVLGGDMVVDFDMIIAKEANTNTETPMHQDESYWPDGMADKRAVTCWIAMDDAKVDNGCMWFVPRSHLLPLRPHRPASEGNHLLCCDGDLAELVAAPIAAGSCTLHHGRTIHYTRGNVTSQRRRAFIINLRPHAMVEYERSVGFDHGLKGLDGVLGKTKVHGTSNCI